VKTLRSAHDASTGSWVDVERSLRSEHDASTGSWSAYARFPHDGVAFSWAEPSGYIRPAYDAVEFRWSPGGAHIAPAMPLRVSWEGSPRYVAPTFPLEVAWGEGAAALWVVLGVDMAAPIPTAELAAEADYFVPEIAGIVTDAMGHPVQRRIRVFDRDSNTFIGETLSDPVTGAYQLQVPGYGEYQRIAMAEDVSDPLLNDLIDRIKVEWPEA